MASDIPADLKYTAEHEWIRMEGERARIGITDHAQDQLTDVVFVELPAVGETFKPGDSMGVVESVKSVSDVYAPLTLTVVEVNDKLEEQPELINDDPYGEGWMVLVEVNDASELEGLLDADGYRKSIEGSG